MAAAGGDLNLPAGFRFHPTDEELVYHYLCRKCASLPIAVPIIAEVDLYKYDPWQLPGMALYGEKEWFFFSPRDRKYPNGSRPNRAASSGYWKATGADKPIGKPKTVGIKKALVFYTGKAPKGEKTDWIMHEYRLADVDRSARNKKSSLRLDDWVLCRIYNKKGFHLQPQKQGLPEWNYQIGDLVEESTPEFSFPEIKPVIPTIQSFPPQSTTDLFHADSSDSIHQHWQESSSSDHVVLSSSEFSTDREVQSERKWGGEFTGGSFFDTNMNLDSLPFSIFDDPKLEFPLVRQPSSDLLFYLQKPF